ncbi:MAG: hypothetical protein EB127_01105 [Alphaproteobacteria bacterium]|nr:hypothetical protein [Alphaproteobacteria bacterium]
MDNSSVLVAAASGLEKNLAGTSGAILKDSVVAQISAAIYYQAQVVSKVTTNKQFQSKFQSVIFKQLEQDFGLYVDSQARVNPKSLHHVYEWNKIGNPGSRLFKLNIASADGLSFKINSTFLPSKSSVPNKFGRRRHVFINKASVMEAGMPLTIRPRSAERLVFETNTGVVYMPKGASVTVTKPGGGASTGRFQIAYARFFTGNLVNLSIKKSGFQRLFNSSLSKAMKLPSDIKRVKYSFSPNTLNMQAESAVAAAFGGMS